MTRIHLFFGTLISAASLAAQTASFPFANNNQFPNNSVSAFSIGLDGTLTPVPGSPFATGGTGFPVGGFIPGNSITTVKDVLHATNMFSANVSAFSVNPTTGVLTPVPGSPFATGGSADTQGIPLAATPDGRFLFAVSPTFQNVAVSA